MLSTLRDLQKILLMPATAYSSSQHLSSVSSGQLSSGYSSNISSPHTISASSRQSSSHGNTRSLEHYSSAVSSEHSTDLYDTTLSELAIKLMMWLDNVCRDEGQEDLPDS